MRNFLTQIKDDIENIRKQFLQYDNKLLQDGYAFDYWILNYLYHIDLEEVEQHITEYNDKGIDCFVYYEDTKELYLLQNSFVQNDSNIKRESVTDFLVNPLLSLNSGTYTRNNELQEIFNSNKEDADFIVYLYYYTTKPIGQISPEIKALFKKSFDYPFKVEAKLISCEGIKALYNGERFKEEINFERDIKVNRNDLIEQLSEQHNKEEHVNTAYVAVNVWEIYEMFNESKKVGYDLFDKNIREYLGTKYKIGCTNKGMQTTLKNEVERNRFFYYNNGITLICDKYNSKKIKRDTIITVKQPQIVNGCQTVNTIVDTIKEISEKIGEKDACQEFKHCSILMKIYEIDKTNEKDKIIYENIVRFTNTQTGITSKDFASKNDYFITLQNDFLKRGFYLIIKQSDKNKFENNAEQFDECRKIAENRCDFFGLPFNKLQDRFVYLDKMLKALLAFYFDAYVAYKSGSSTLKETSDKYYSGFSKNIKDFFTTDNMINLYLTYIKSGGIKSGRGERYPIPYYMMDFMGRYIKGKEYNFEQVKKN